MKHPFLKAQLHNFWYWIEERHQIYLNRQAGMQWPWTDDDILQTYRFCNPFRELDTGTVWLRQNWLEPWEGHENLLFNICLYRYFNWWPTAEFLGYTTAKNWNPESIIVGLRQWRHKGNKVFTGAHMMTGQILRPDGTPCEDKIEQVITYVLDPIWNMQLIHADIIKREGTLEAAFQQLLPLKGFGPFVAYEVVTDLYHTHYLKDAPDIMTWANPGPGAMRGINRLRGLPFTTFNNKKQSTEQYIDDMRLLLKMAFDQLDAHIPRDANFDMRMIEHSLCEFDKYSRILNGEGRTRSKFVPPHERV